MGRQVETEEVQRLATQGAQLLEVLPRPAYDAEHLPGARNIPLEELTRESIGQAGLDREQTTVVYCYDHECDLSARGAALLETFGFTDVCDYVASKTAWMGQGLPVEGTNSVSARAGAIAHEVGVCGFHDQLGDLGDRFTGSPGICAVVDGAQVVLGIVREDATRLPGHIEVAQVMQSAPPSVRPSITASELAESMDRDARTYVLVTTSHGELIGLIQRADLHGQH